MGLYLYGVHGARRERCVREGLGRAQKIAHAVEVVLVLLDGLDAQTVPRQHGFVTRSVAWWRQELEVSVAASQEKPQPACVKMSLKKSFVKGITCEKTMEDLLRYACREADDGEEKAVQVEVLKHSLDRMAVDTEGDTGHAQIQTAADNVLCCQDVLVG